MLADELAEEVESLFPRQVKESYVAGQFEAVLRRRLLPAAGYSLPLGELRLKGAKNEHG
jgi:hypothetical protein